MDAAPPPLLPSLAIQARVVGALLMREVLTRFGRHNVGFLWLFLEPMLFTAGVILLWSLGPQGTAQKAPIVPFIATGYSTMLLWRNCASRGIKAIEANRSLLNHRNVRLMDIFAARMLLELAGVTASFCAVMLALWSIGLLATPHDVLMMLAGWGLMAWFSAALGTVLGCLSEHTELVERIWHPLSYFLLFVSGAFFMVAWLPAEWRAAALWVPMVHATELLRAGYFGPQQVTFQEPAYLVGWCMVLTLVALLLLRDTRSLLEQRR
jgi:capsular polysaccharide transport system permease protein